MIGPLSTLGEKVAPLATQALDFINVKESVETVLKADPVGALTKAFVGVGSLYLGAKAFSKAWNSESKGAKTARYITSLSLFALAAYEATASLYGRVSIGESYMPSFVPHVHDEL